MSVKPEDIQAVMVVCGDEEYYRMSEYSIRSFTKSNPGTILNVFADRPKEIKQVEGCVVWDYRSSLNTLKACPESRHKAIIDRIERKDFDNNGVKHVHEYVAMLPLIADMYLHCDWILKIDCDGFFYGDMMAEVREKPLEKHDVWLVSRTRADMHKLFAGVPGVGFALWRRESDFVKLYCDNFDGNEQNTIIYTAGYRHRRKTHNYCGIFTEENWHICYPFEMAKLSGFELDKEDIDEWVPFYLHLRGPGQLDKMKRLEEWYANPIN